jgi:hypothetical protein
MIDWDKVSLGCCPSGMTDLPIVRPSHASSLKVSKSKVEYPQTSPAPGTLDLMTKQNSQIAGAFLESLAIKI